MNIKAIVGSFCLSVLFVGCASHKPPSHSERMLEPLPSGYLLGASNLEERDDICEAVFRFVAAKHLHEACFIGFENVIQNRAVCHDPTNKLLKRLGDLPPSVIPASQASSAWTRNGMIPTGVICWIWGISKDSENEVHVTARIESHPYGGGRSYDYRLVRDNGKWKATEEQMKDWL